MPKKLEHGGKSYSCNVEPPVRRDGKLHYRASVSGRALISSFPEYISKPAPEGASDSEISKHTAAESVKRKDYFESCADKALTAAINAVLGKEEKPAKVEKPKAPPLAEGPAVKKAVAEDDEVTKEIPPKPVKSRAKGKK